MKYLIWIAALAACGSRARAHVYDDAGAGGDAGSGSCSGIACDVVDCSGHGGPTTLTGTVYAPNGTLPLYGVNVYVPATTPPAITAGLDGTCDLCQDGPPGDPIALATTDEHGQFSLENVPVVANLPVVIQIGKWRKILSIAQPVTACTTTALPVLDTKLPASQSESGGDIASVDLPRIAISTGAYDAPECLVRKLGIADSEFTTMGGSGHVHLFTDTGAHDTGSGGSNGQGADRFATGFAGGTGPFINSETLWGSSLPNSDILADYDVVMLSCEGKHYPQTKTQAALNAMKKYADGGGRVFMSHWQNIWIEGDGSTAPDVWPDLATFDPNGPQLDGSNVDTIETDATKNPKGQSFATWMADPAVGGSTTPDLVPVADGYRTCESVDTDTVETWVYLDGVHNSPTSLTGVQNFQFQTPAEAVDHCGKVVFSDMHVSADSTSTPGTPGFPMGCSSGPLTPQETALAFMFFDIASCLGPPIE